MSVPSHIIYQILNLARGIYIAIELDSISHHTYYYDHGVFQRSASLPAAENNILCCPFPAVWAFGDSDYLPRV